jgi:hypothetical protein
VLVERIGHTDITPEQRSIVAALLAIASRAVAEGAAVGFVTIGVVGDGVGVEINGPAGEQRRQIMAGVLRNGVTPALVAEVVWDQLMKGTDG